MSMAATLDRIQQIQGTLSALSPAAPLSAAPSRGAAPAPGAGAPATVQSAQNASAFAQALTAAGVPADAAQSAAAALGSVPAPSGVQGVPAASPDPGGSGVEAAARKYVGLPYIWGGNDPSAGLDCSSFVQHVYRDLGYELPRTTWDQVNSGTPVGSLAEARPGDLLFTFNTGHVSIYLGNGKVVDAPQPGSTIQIRDAWENDSNIDAIRRILPAGSAAAGPGTALIGAGR